MPSLHFSGVGWKLGQERDDGQLDAHAAMFENGFHKRQSSDYRQRPIASSNAPIVILPVMILFFAVLLTIFCVKHKSRQQARQDAVTAVAPEDTPTILEKRHDALKALEPVTEGIDPLAESTPSSQQPQATSGADLRTHSEISGEQECPICLTPLYSPAPPEPVLLTLDDTAYNATKSTRTANTPSMVQPPTAIPLAPVPVDSTRPTALKLKSCGHEFHAECLVSWFLNTRFDCPVCRREYWGEGVRDSDERKDGEVVRKEEVDTRPLEGISGPSGEGQNGGKSDGGTIAKPAGGEAAVAQPWDDWGNERK